ncbi:hypothetical protein [Mangrovihabitans endophyticus]|uniref:Head-to-tail adaptor n=1 Tax=Mangrovihabitans endophyticus TaxID=1751298 RepID=A0A8J3BXR6_9ACTN|nr:hypothetical protein [Mangrovihabitans endophyticus]GGK89203.1 hypothetical protein GCM10012284_24020 [Mangrovihabitans endophyticus]
MADRPTLASDAQLYAKIGYTPAGDEATRATGCLVDASELIRDEAGKTWLNEAGDEVEDVPPRVQRICVAAAYRAFANPEGLSQRSIADSSKSYDRTGREGGEDVYLTDREIRAVRRAAGGSSFAAVTVVSPWSGDES